MTPALWTRTCKGPSQSFTKASTERRSETSRYRTPMARLPVVAVMSAAVLRTASVISAPVRARVRAVSTPIPDVAPVTTIRRPVRSMPSATSSAVEAKPKGVVMRDMGQVPQEPRM